MNFYAVLYGHVTAQCAAMLWAMIMRVIDFCLELKSIRVANDCRVSHRLSADIDSGLFDLKVAVL